MASGDDYIGLQFGSFVIERSIGRGREAEVYGVLNRATGRRYALRLDTEDDALWEGPPLNPPRNFSLESKNARGSWFAKLEYEERSRREKSEWRVNVPVLFGLKDLAYLIPVSSPFSLRGAMDFETFLRITPPDDLYLFETWEDVALTMLGDAHAANTGALAEEGWNARWAILLGGDILCRAMAQYMAAGHLSDTDRNAVIARISRGDGQGSELAHNLLLRMCGAISRGRISLENAKQTVRDRFFRENLTIREINQIISCLSILVQQEVEPTLSLSLLQELLSMLEKQPPDRWHHPHEFEQAPAQDFQQFIEQRALSRFSLFFQELAADQKFLAVGGA